MNYRAKKLLKAAEACYICMGCGKPNDGTIVAAHSNQQRDGKGTGIKAHDYRIAYLCSECHYFVDDGKAARDARIDLWENAHRKTIAYLFNEGIVE